MDSEEMMAAVIEELEMDNYLLRLEVASRGMELDKLKSQLRVLQSQISTYKKEQVAALLKAKEE